MCPGGILRDLRLVDFLHRVQRREGMAPVRHWAAASDVSTLDRESSVPEEGILPDVLGIRHLSRALTGVTLVAPPEIEQQHGRADHECDAA